MKTLFKKSLLVLMVMFIAVISLGVTSKVKAEEEVYKTLTFTSTTMQTSVNTYTSTWNTKCDGDTWKIANANNNNKGWNYIRMGRKNYASVATISTAFAIDKAVTKVVMTVDSVTTTSINSLKLTVATDSNFSNVVETVSATAKTGAVTFNISNPTPSAYYKITVDCKSASKNGIIQVSKVQYYADSAAEASPSISLKGDSYTEVEDVTTLTATLSNLTGTVVWSSSNPAVASVDQSGNVTALSMGTTTITASVGEVKATQDFVVYPTDGSLLTVAEAIAVCKLTGNANSPFKYKAQGTVSDVSYNTTFANYTYNLTDETGTIKVYGSKGDCELQDGYVVIVNGNLINYSGSTPEFNTNTTFERVVDESLDTFLANLNSVKSYMSLAYKYSVTQQEVAAEIEVVDTLNLNFTGVSAGTNYASWSGKQSESNAVWAGQSAGDKSSIQLRSKNNNSGVITTKSGGKIAKIIVTWHADTAAGRTLDVYGKHSAYSNPTELYDSSTQGEKLGSIVKGTTIELEISGDYEYVGLRSADGAMYITEIKVVWNVESEGTVVEDTYKDVDFRIKCGIDANINALENLPAGKEYTSGIRVKTLDKEVLYNNEEHADLIKTDSNVLYTVISLGNVLTNTSRLDVAFSVQAYVCVDGQYYYSDQVKTLSVIDLVKVYYEMADYKEQVTPLVEVLTSLGYSFE